MFLSICQLTSPLSQCVSGVEELNRLRTGGLWRPREEWVTFSVLRMGGVTSPGSRGLDDIESSRILEKLVSPSRPPTKSLNYCKVNPAYLDKKRYMLLNPQTGNHIRGVKFALKLMKIIVLYQ